MWTIIRRKKIVAIIRTVVSVHMYRSAQHPVRHSLSVYAGSFQNYSYCHCHCTENWSLMRVLFIIHGQRYPQMTLLAGIIVVDIVPWARRCLVSPSSWLLSCSIGQSVVPQVSQLFHRSVSCSIGQSVIPQVSQLLHRSVCCSIGQLVVPSVSQLFSRSVGCPIGQSVIPSVSQLFHR